MVIILNIFNYNNFNIEQKSNNFQIQTNRKNASTQTDPKLLYIEEEKDTIELNTNYFKTRKDSPDLIRDKIFKFFNKMLYEWILSTKTSKDDIEIIRYSFKNNKKFIVESMKKYLKELFVKENQISAVNKINNELLKNKLERKYEDIYKIFISEQNINIGNFYDNFKFLKDFLKDMEEKNEKKEYIDKVKDIALRYEEWKGKKIHFSK